MRPERRPDIESRLKSLRGTEGGIASQLQQGFGEECIAVGRREHVKVDWDSAWRSDEATEGGRFPSPKSLAVFLTTRFLPLSRRAVYTHLEGLPDLLS